MAQISISGKESTYVGRDEWYGSVFACTKCGKKQLWWAFISDGPDRGDNDDFRFCPHCGEPIEWVE